MAAIEQIIQIAANERVAGAANTLAGTANTTANTAASNASTALTRAAAAQTTADGAIQHTAFTVNQTAIDSGYISVSGSGNSRTYTLNAPAAVNLSDVRTYTNATARNAISDVAWHTGDIAILSESEMRPGEMMFTATPLTILLGGGATNQLRVLNGWDTTLNAAQPGARANDVIRFSGDSGATFRGSGSGGSGTDWTVDPTEQLSGTIARITLDRVPNSNDGLDNGDVIYLGAAGTPSTIVSGTYLYTGATSGDNHTGVTVDADWTLLNVPAGTASNSDLATFELNGGAPAILGSVEYNSTTDVLTINSQQIDLATTPVSFSRNFYQYTGADLVITGLGPTGTGDQEFTVTISGNWTSRFGAAVPTSWPNSASLFGNGMKLSYGPAANGNDWVIDGARTTITITVSQAQRRELGAGESRSLLLEMETIT